MRKFNNKTIWIIGASSGLGEALAYAFNKEGANIILSARKESLLHSINEKIDSGIVIPLDLEQSKTFETKTQEAIHAFGSIDYIILNAGIAQRSTVWETQPEVEKKIMEIDYFSYTKLTRSILPHFMKNKKGHIIVVSGLLAQINLPKRSSYAAAKSALLGYFGCLRAELVEENINITLLIPGSIKTELANKALDKNGDQIKEVNPVVGIEPEKAALQILKAIENKKYQTYIGNKDKAFILWKISKLYPNFITKILLKQKN